MFLYVYETCLKKLVMVSVAGLKPVRLQDSSPLVVLSRERLPMMLEFLRSDHEPFLSAHSKRRGQESYLFSIPTDRRNTVHFLNLPSNKKVTTMFKNTP